MTKFRQRKYKITDVGNVSAAFIECLDAMRDKFKNNILRAAPVITNDDRGAEIPADKEELLSKV